MTRAIRLGGEFLAGDDEVVVEVPHNKVGDLALELAVLLYGDPGASITLVSGEGQAIALIGTNERSAPRAFVRRTADNRWEFLLSTNLVGYVLAFLVRAYRDQVAEVNHIHVEGLMGPKSFDLTLMFDRYRTPMSHDEAEKRMGS